MVFSGIPFLYSFLPSVLIVYALVPKRMKNAVLFFSSMLFYAWGEQLLVLLFAAVILCGWLSGLLLERTEGAGPRKAVMILAVMLDLGLLGWFKYADFFVDNLNALLGTSIPAARVILPIGISFYTFQLLSYTVDVYRGTVRAQHNFIDFAAYVSMFPQLIAGPIVRYADVEQQLAGRRHDLSKTAAGIRRFVAGLSKKVLIANVLGGLVSACRMTQSPSVLYYWLYAAAYSLQVYFDFSGYSDMAIGLGKLFGFDLPENFDYPYISASITEFWRRWHMTLGGWFRDYVYIPMGGTRKGLPRQLLNILVVWMLTGLWHGASWNFVFWGLWFAMLLTIEKLGFKGWLDRHRTTGHIYVIIAVLLSFTVFDSADLSGALTVLSGMLGLSGLPAVSAEAVYGLRSYFFVLILAGVFATPLPKRLYEVLVRRRRAERIAAVLEPLVLTALLLIATAYLADGSFNPFLYFRF